MKVTTPTLALVITTFNSAKSLKYLFFSVLGQSVLPEEIIIADDGSTDETELVISKLKDGYDGIVTHVRQENMGYRRSKILNKAILTAKSDYIVTVDSDVVLHDKFIADHKAVARENSFVCGRRARIREVYADRIKASEKVDIPSPFSLKIKRPLRSLRFPPLSLLFRNRHKHSCRQLIGSNLGFWKTDFMKINGFEEKFEGWGPEDREFCLRLMNSNCRRITLNYMAIQYHLDHPVRSSHPNLEANQQIFVEARKEHKLRAEIGVDQYLAFE